MSLYRLKQHILARLDKIEAAAKDPSTLVKQLANLGLASALKSFPDQQLGDLEWSERYPNMAPPFLNIAGAIKDFNAGRKEPKPNRFQDRPANIDEGKRGGLWGDLTTSDDSGDFVASWGSDKEYASLMQEGGEMVQTITLSAKWRIWEYLYTGLFTNREKLSKRAVKGTQKEEMKIVPKNEQKNPSQAEIKKEMDALQKQMKKYKGNRTKEEKLLARHGVKDPSKGHGFDRLYDAAFNKAFKKKNQKRVAVATGRAGATHQQKSGYNRSDYASKLKWATNPDVQEWSHGIGARPFLGITDDTEKDMIEAVENYFRKAQQ